MSTHLVAQRLRQLRRELAGPNGKLWNQARVADAGLMLNALARLEQSGAGTIEVLLAVLTFYHTRGFNPNCVVLVDNAGVSKREPVGVKMVQLAEAVKKVQEMSARL